MGKSVLIVDDSTVTRHALRYILEAEGYTVYETDGGEQGLATLEELTAANTPVKAIFADLNMPTMNGFEFVRRVRAMRRFDDVPILMLTTESRQDRINEGKNAGANAWIVKPLHRDYLLSMLKKHLKDDE